MEQTKRVAIYARVSSATQAKRDLSIPEQVRQVKAFCTARGWLVVAEFKDVAKSGAETVNRPGLQQMLRAASSKARPFDLILTRELSRFGRSDEDAALRTRLREHGVAIDNITQPSGDMDEALTPGGAFMERIQSAVDIHARQVSTVQMIAGQKAKARKGGLAGAQATCYGYRQEWVSVAGSRPIRTPVLDKRKAKVVREMFHRYIVGDSLNKITRWLNETGIAAPRGAEWYDSTIRKILSNETYLGRLIYGRIRKVKHPVTRTPVNVRNDGEIIRVDNAFPAIVDQETFDKVQMILERNESTRPQGGHPGNTLRGIGKCAACGWHLAHQRSTSTGKWYYMCGRVKTEGAAGKPECKGIVQAEYVDTVVALLLRYMSKITPTSIRERIAQYNSAVTELTGLQATEALGIAIAEHETMVQNLASAIAKMGDSPSLLQNLATAEAKLNELRSKRETIAATVRTAPVDANAVLQAKSKIPSVLRKGDTVRMRALLEILVSAVECDWRWRKREPVDLNLIGTRPVEFRSDKERLMMRPMSPLFFVLKWDIFRSERAAEEALRKVAAVLTSENFKPSRTAANRDKPKKLQTPMRAGERVERPRVLASLDSPMD
jgi:site-specific DNA recombinase